MARLARVIAPGFPHHVTQRGNRRMQTFLCDEDYQTYLELMSEWCRKCKVAVWAYCLMPNHVHLIAVPQSEDGLRRAVGEAHRRYTRSINFREGWRGHLWQGRFASFPMDERHLIAAARYIELNPLRAGLVDELAAWRWSSLSAHLSGSDDLLVTAKPLLDLVGEWDEFVRDCAGDQDLETLRRHERTGRPLGSQDFVRLIEDAVGRMLKRRKPGPKSKREPGS